MAAQDFPVKIVLLDHYDRDLPLPRYETAGSAGADVRACLRPETSLTIAPWKRVLVPTGLAMEIPPGFELQVRPRSGLSLKTPLFLCNSPGTIDSDYRGEIKIIMGNLSHDPHVIRHGDRIAQLLLCPVTRAEFRVHTELSPSQRGGEGFGSTGVR